MSVVVTPAVGVPAGAPSTPPTITQPVRGHLEAVCPKGCVASESAGRYANLRMGPFTVEDYQESDYLVLSQPMTIGLIDGWMGTDAGAAFEADARLEIQYPDGTWEEFLLQHDKHQDTIGNVRLQWKVNRALPSGTRFVLKHGQGYSVDGKALNTLHADAMFRLYAE
jgi:hypothetical protein